MNFATNGTMDKSSNASPSPSGLETNGVSEVNEHASPGAPNDGASDAELDGDEFDPIVICGFSLKFPQEATSAEAFWKMMVEKRCAMTEFPPNRLNANGFHQGRKRLQTVCRNNKRLAQVPSPRATLSVILVASPRWTLYPR